ncbi:GAF domain-containing protein [Actinokineospora sp. UTMC 2448]|uniref:helix-turn-helix domain-containing protein n=1 Tax=Actinokineospora sp. UTMC 2448 TaxID=2268449 RepID=UPI0021644388|nr:GAF domain-containing protein [Actinokineospora sp. UTMC 2448]UVS79134.1 fused phosphoenolpyruvate-protein phosphotransferase PtsP/GAF domain protein [Actinokineospora sp. UTMC 2448]
MDGVAFRLLELVAAGAGSDELARLAVEEPGSAAAVELALRINATVRGHRRREAELSALFDTAGDLARLRDPDAVLRSIVHRARRLLGVDLSYLTLNDADAGITYMRVTDGSVSPLFPQVRMKMGVGLGGLVAQTARPYTTPDYLSDQHFLHSDPVDDAVRGEGLTALLAVPLAVGDTVIGVLYAADRAAREFTPDEIALLSSLADHAAIALDNARLLAEVSAHSEAVQRAEAAHDRLMDLVLRGGDIAAVAAAVADVLHGGIGVYTTGGGELAHAGLPTSAPAPDAVAASYNSGRATRTERGWVCAVQAGPELLGSIVLTTDTELTDADRHLFERAAVVTALLQLLRRSVAKAEDEVRGELLTDLLTAPDRNPGTLVDRGRHLGVDLTTRHAVFIAHADGVSRRRLAAAAAQFAALSGIHAEQVVLLAQTEAPGALAARVAAALGAQAGCPVTVAAGGPARGPTGLAAAYREAERCLRALLRLGRDGTGASMAELGFIGLVLADRADHAGFIQQTLGPVFDYDRDRGTELIRTLEAYFTSGCSLPRTKDLLHIHVNTVGQRLDRIGRLLGPDWQSPDRILEIQLALRLHSLQAT